MTPPPRPRRLRDARGPVVASVATAVALLAHVTGGGAVPGWLGILVPWALSLAVCTALAGRRLAIWRTTTSVALSQVLFHTLFVLGAPGTPGASAPGGTTSAGRAMGHGMHGAHPLPSSGRPPHLPELLGADATMWLWHGVAALATIAVLYGGERTVQRLRGLAVRTAQWLRHRLAVPANAAVPVPVVRVVAPDWFTGSYPARPEVSPSRRRGPPRALAV